MTAVHQPAGAGATSPAGPAPVHPATNRAAPPAGPAPANPPAGAAVGAAPARGLPPYGVPAAARPLRFDPGRCTGCNRCVEVCQLDVLHPSPEKGKPPLVAYPGECWYCGACVMECPRPGAIRLQHPLMNRVHWRPRPPQAGGEAAPRQE